MSSIDQGEGPKSCRVGTSPNLEKRHETSRTLLHTYACGVMTTKIKSKDLEYDASLPPFLQRLRDQNAGRGDQDRHERAIARPKKAKDSEEDDEPIVVDESGETISKEALEDLKGSDSACITSAENVGARLDPSTEPVASGAIPDGEPLEGSKGTNTKVTDGMAQKKRKVAKVVGENAHATARNEDDGSKTTKRAKKKAKPVKLTFDDNEPS